MNCGSVIVLSVTILVPFTCECLLSGVLLHLHRSLYCMLAFCFL